MSARRKSYAATRQEHDGGTQRAQTAELSRGDGLNATRVKMVQDRQEELDRVLDTHDSLVCSPLPPWNDTDINQVREAFHLEKFVSLLTYDPKVRILPSLFHFPSPQKG